MPASAALAQDAGLDGGPWPWTLFFLALGLAAWLAWRCRQERGAAGDWAHFPQDNPFPVLRISLQGLILYANPASDELLGHWGTGRGGAAPAEVVQLARRTAGGQGLPEMEVRLGGRVLSLIFSRVAGQGYVHVYSRDVTEAKQAQESLAASERNYRTIFNSVQEAIFLHDAADGRTLDANQQASQMFGYNTQELMSKDVGQLSSGEEPYTQQRAEEVIRAAAAGRPQVVEWQCKDKDGRLFWVEVSVKRARIDQREVVLAVLRNISQRKEAEKQLTLAAQVFDSAMEGIMVTDPQGDIQTINPAFTAITGYSAEEVRGRNPRMLNSGRHPQEFYEQMWQALRSRGQWQGEIWNRDKNGEAFPQWLTITAIKDSEGRTIHYLGMFHDLSELRQDQARMEYRAFHDPLTALPNRLLLTDRLRMSLARSLRHGRPLAVMFCDLDGFKVVNDTLGHALGDLLLQEVARRLGSILREEDTVGRQGGDEFVMILPDMADASYAEVAARRVLGAVAKPYQLEGHQVRITTSLGIALHPRDGGDPQTLLQRADEAMYRAKQAGRNTYRLWRPEYARSARPAQDQSHEANGA
ncbi:MAG: diguanylate cyclase [Thermodesulfobacteriota bacterium]